jgi:hypothetical protein
LHSWCAALNDSRRPTRTVISLVFFRELLLTIEYRVRLSRSEADLASVSCLDDRVGGRLDLEEIASALSDQTDYEHH